MRAYITLSLVVAVMPLASATAQQPTRLGRAEAIAAATGKGPRLAVAGADTAIAAAELRAARAFPNPTLSAAYSRDIPRYHLTAELPLDFLSVRGTKVRSAEASRLAARYRFAFNRELLALDADTGYTRAAAARAQLALTMRNAEGADSLLRVALARRDAGDVSDLDVELARLFAGQQLNLLAADSLTMVSALLDLQALIGLPLDRVVIELTDSLAPPALAATPRGPLPDSTLPVVSAAAALQAADLALRLERRSVVGMPGLMFGFDAGDPTGETRGLLPTFGIALPLPIFNRNKGPIAVAQAERDRATAELAVAQVESRAAIGRATREFASANAQLARDQLLVTAANRVAAMSTAAYREGAAPLTSVLEAQRNARDVLRQYIEDVARANIAAATLRALTTTATPGTP